MRIAIIPARGGSKRIPRKNIRPFAGQPLIAYSIKAARECGLFDHVIVSTDDKEIAAIARRAGQRPRHHGAGDTPGGAVGAGAHGPGGAGVLHLRHSSLPASRCAARRALG